MKVLYNEKEYELKKVHDSDVYSYFVIEPTEIFTHFDISRLEKQGFKFIGIHSIPVLNKTLVTIEKIPFL